MEQGPRDRSIDGINSCDADLLAIPLTLTKRVFLIVIGSIALVLGSIGVIVPLLPTTPFLLVASWCYLRSSERLYRWLLTRKFFRRHINKIIEDKGLTLRSKAMILGAVWAMLLILIIFVFDSLTMRFVAFALGTVKTLFFIFILKTTDR